ncbi:hypothetical protein Y032_0065g3681 [Ancylostoma ceylanicum]|uniref:G-protein coupled receptors family 1 profile domain-containing protein n=1 Tax=Ancylostoma ceylanicum TaxID=53326 RepID=A0A016U121_9BILA|nr:hypothetical protein Y032_0065g3681 [Ancylostoma ceylanicum]
MDTLSPSVDALSYVLFSIEILMNILFIPTVCLLFYICVVQKNLHVNFRSTLFLTGVGYLLGDIHRLILVTARMCCIAQQSTPLVQKLAVVQLVGAYISLFGWLFVTIERAIATVFTGNYEKKCSGFAAPVALCSAVLLLAALACCVTSLRLIKNVDFIIMGLQIFLVVMCFVALAVIVMFNTSAYRKRHNAMMQLSNRYQLDENIRGSRYLIPVALNDVLVKVAFILLMAYSIFFTDIPLGHDTTHLSHAYDLLGSYQRLFFGLALTLRSQRFDHLLKRRKKTTKAIEKQATASITPGKGGPTKLCDWSVHSISQSQSSRTAHTGYGALNSTLDLR